MAVRTRFAPSPTGYLHIGGVRTAFFNWLFARQQGGQFILRVDDTDQERNIEAALQPILDGFRWLGIDWDEGPEVGSEHGPYFQSQRLEIYQSAVNDLLSKGLAYRDFAKPEEIQAEREQAEQAKTDFRYSRKWMAESEEDAERFISEGRSSVVRLKMPREGACEFSDHVRGEMKIQWSTEADHVIQRADGSCLYHLANVVDDHAYGITHVIRANEHLSNTPRQIFIAEGLGYQLPEYVHLPFVAEPGSKTKLSKRKLDKYFKNRDFKKMFDHAKSIADRIGLEVAPESFNPVLVDFYREVGYLPEAILNYLLLLGWSLDGETEHFDLETMIREFNFERIVKSPASFDPAKLMAFEQRHMNLLPVAEKTELAIPFLQRAGLLADEVTADDRTRVEKIVAASGDRMMVAGDILDFDDFFRADDQLNIDEKAFNKRLIKDEEAVGRLEEFADDLKSVEPFSAEELQQALNQFVERKEIKIGQIIHALRVGATGKGVGFGMFETMEILGRDSVLRRIEWVTQQCRAS